MRWAARSPGRRFGEPPGSRRRGGRVGKARPPGSVAGSWRAIVATSGPAAGMEGSVAVMVRKRPCSICGAWFQPDARVGDRQHACTDPECQHGRRRRKQAQWRRRNPDYFVARRWSAATEAKVAEPARAPPPLEQIPWDVVQSQMSSQPAVILGLFGRVLLIHVQSQMRAQVSVITGESPRLPPRRAQSQMETQPGSLHPRARDDGAGGGHP